MRKLILSDVHSHWLHLKYLVETLEVVVDFAGNILYFPDDLIIYNLGDEIDRGDFPVEVLRFVSQGLEIGKIFSVLGNHSSKVYRYLKGNKVELWDEQLQTIELIKGHEDWIKEFYSKIPYFIKLPETTLVHGQYSPNGNPKRYMYARANKDEYPNQKELGADDRFKWFEHYDGKHGHIVCGHFGLDRAFVGKDCICIDSGVFRTGIFSGWLYEDEDIRGGKSIEVTL